MLRRCDEPLAAAYDLVMLDLDGVVYVGRNAVAGAVAAVDDARAHGVRVGFVTNNAAREPEVVARHLRDLGIPAEATDVVTSSQAAAHLVAAWFGRGAKVFAAGGPGVWAALRAEGLEPVDVADAAVAVVTGYGPELPWRQVMRAAMLVRAGLPWVATNADLTIPTEAGVGPGHGALVRLVEEFSGVLAVVAGKPARPLLDEAVRRIGGQRPLMVGDRLDTDVEGAHNAGIDSLLVLTGVSRLVDLAAATPAERPSYIAVDLGGLLSAHPVPDIVRERAELGGWSGRVIDGDLEITGAGAEGDWWRVAAVAAWRHLDATGRPAVLDGVRGSVAWIP